MNNESNEEFKRLEAKIDEIYFSVEKTRKYFLIIMWVSVGAIVIPAIGLAFIIPSFIDIYTSSLRGLI